MNGCQHAIKFHKDVLACAAILFVLTAAAAQEVPPSSDEGRLAQAQSYVKAGRIRDAVVEAQDILKHDPSNLGAHKLLGAIYLRSLGDMPGGGDGSNSVVKLAIEQYEQIVKIEPHHVDDHLLLGRLYRLNNDLRKAEDEFKTALKLDTGSEEAITTLALLYSDESDTTHALQVLNSVPVTSRSTKLYAALGAIYEQRKEYKSAIDAYRHAIQLDRDNTDAIRGLAKNLVNDGQTESALDQYKLIASAHPEDAQTYFGISEIYRRQGHYDEALQSLKKADVVAPNSLEVPYNMAVIYQMQGRWELAAQILQDLLLMTNKLDGNYSQPDKNNRAIFLERQGTIYRDNNNEILAIQDFRKLLALGDENAARGFQQIIDTYRANNEWQLATDTAREAIQKLPDDRALKLVYAAQLADMGQPEEGVRQAKTLLRATPEDREVYLALAQMYTRLKQWPEADEALDKATRLSTKDEDREYVGFLRGSAYEKEKKYDAAEEAFRKVLVNDPQNAAALNYLGYLLAERGTKLDEALTLTKKAVSLDPSNAQYLDSLGWVYFKLGQYQEAETDLVKASGRLKADPDIQVHLGRLYEKTGRIKLAVDCWNSAIEEWNKTVAAEVDSEELAQVQSDLRSAKVMMAHSPEQAGRGVPPPPKPTADGPDLAATMQFIQDKLNSVGPMNFAANFHDSATSSDWTDQFKVAPTRVLADPSGCRIDYHWRSETNGSVRGDFDDWFYLKNVEDIVVLPLDQQQKEWNAAAGHPSWNSSVEPAVFLLKVRRADLSKTNLFHFFDEQLANRVAKAMVHAVELCGGGSQSEPF
jgi:tetratricopeptide (TPR) repeat protein